MDERHCRCGAYPNIVAAIRISYCAEPPSPDIPALLDTAFQPPQMQ